MGFSRQEYWNRFPFSSSGELPDPGIEPGSPAVWVDSLLTELWGKPSGCERWSIKKAECWRIDTFKLWFWRRLLKILWTAGRSNQSILKEINPKYSLKELILKLKLQYFGYLVQRADSFWKRPYDGKEWKQKEKWASWWDREHHWLSGHEFKQTSRDGGWQRSLKYYSPWVHKELDTA